MIEYLSKKGYSRTEAMLRTESAAYDPDGPPTLNTTDDDGGRKFIKAAGMDRPFHVLVLPH